MNLLENCSECYQFTLSQFPDNITIIGNLEPNTDYYLWITDKFNNIFCTDAIETGASGTIVIGAEIIAELPKGLFSKDAGTFKIEAKPVGVYYSGVADFTFDTVTYSCILVDFQFNNSPKTVIL